MFLFYFLRFHRMILFFCSNISVIYFLRFIRMILFFRSNISVHRYIVIPSPSEKAIIIGVYNKCAVPCMTNTIWAPFISRTVVSPSAKTLSLTNSRSIYSASVMNQSMAVILDFSDKEMYWCITYFVGEPNGTECRIPRQH